MPRLKRKASSIVEYAVVLGVVSMALSAMGTYIKRGLQASTRTMAIKLIAEDLYDRHLNAVASGCNPDIDPSCLRGAHQYVSGQATSNATITMNNRVGKITAGRITNSTTNETINRTADDYSVGAGWENLLP